MPATFPGRPARRPAAAFPLGALLALLLAVVAGCGAPPETSPPEDRVEIAADEGSGHTEATPAGTDIDSLRALPYLSFSPEPADPAKKGVVALDRARSAPGYNLYTVRDLCTAELISPTGGLINRWQGQDCRQWSNVELLPDGDLLVVGIDRLKKDNRDDRQARKARRATAAEGATTAAIPFEARFLARLAWDGRQRFKVQAPVHHDVSPTAAGTLLALGAGYRQLDEPPPLYDNLLLRLSADGEVLGQTSLYDAFRAGPFPFTFQEVAPKKNQDGVVAIDLFHANAITENPFPELAGRHPLYGAGNLLLSSRHQDVLAILDPAGRRLLWAWGQGELSGPHDARWLPSGHLLVFDNGLGRGWSRILEVDPVRGEVVWSYQAEPQEDFFTASRGSNQRLPNGNTLISESDRGRAFEITPAGEIVWEFYCPYLNKKGQRATIVRIRRYPPQVVDAMRPPRR